MFSIGVTVSATYFRLAGMNKGVYFSCSNALPLYSLANSQAQGWNRVKYINAGTRVR